MSFFWWTHKILWGVWQLLLATDLYVFLATANWMGTKISLPKNIVCSKYKDFFEVFKFLLLSMRNTTQFQEPLPFSSRWGLCYNDCVSIIRNLFKIEMGRTNKWLFFFLYVQKSSAVKWLILINRIQNKSFCLHNICVYTYYTYI